MWRTLHAIALNYPEQPSAQQVDSHRTFFNVLQHVIPCHTCATSYTRHLEEVPLEPNLGGGDKLFAWTVDIHNLVNKELGKPQLSKEEARMLHGGVPGTRESPWGNGLLAVILATLALLAGLVMVMFYRSSKKRKT